MKTFDEALDSICVRREGTREEVTRHMSATVEEMTGRYGSLIEEIIVSGKVDVLVHAMRHLYMDAFEGIEETPTEEQAARVESAFKSIVVSAFTNGVLVGITMERQELPDMSGHVPMSESG